MKIKSKLLLYAPLMLLMLMACGALSPKPTPTLLPEPTQTLPAPEITNNATTFYFVTNKLLLPTTLAQAQAYALNIDNDAQQHPDNLFGELLTTLTNAAPGLDVQSNTDEAINAGRLITLHTIEVGDPLNSAIAQWLIYRGKSPKTTPKFNGSDKFLLHPSTLNNSRFIGSVTEGLFVSNPSSANIEFILLGKQIDVNLIGVRIEANINADGCSNGKLGGGVTVEEFRNKILPALADGINLLINSNPTSANILMLAFDTDNNAVISDTEIENNILLKSLTSPDLDLLDSSGNFNPGQDGIKDSLSLGLGFTCVPATFNAPTE